MDQGGEINYSQWICHKTGEGGEWGENHVNKNLRFNKF